MSTIFNVLYSLIACFFFFFSTEKSHKKSLFINLGLLSVIITLYLHSVIFTHRHLVLPAASINFWSSAPTTFTTKSEDVRLLFLWLALFNCATTQHFITVLRFGICSLIKALLRDSCQSPTYWDIIYRNANKLKTRY